MRGAHELGGGDQRGKERNKGGVMDDDIKPGSGGRPAGCFYFSEDHERAALHAIGRLPDVFRAIQGDVDLANVTQDQALSMLNAAIQEVLPKASLVDLGKTILSIRLKARPPSEEQDLKFREYLDISARQAAVIKERLKNRPT